MWLSKLRLEIFAVLLAVPACGSERQFGADEETGNTNPLEACSEGDGTVIFDGSRDTGFVRCPDGRINRVRAVTCQAGGECQSDADCGPQHMCICPDGEVFDIPDLWHQGGSCH